MYVELDFSCKDTVPDREQNVAVDTLDHDHIVVNESVDANVM